MSARPPLLHAPSSWSARLDNGALSSNFHDEEPLLRSISVVQKNDFGPERDHAKLLMARKENDPPSTSNLRRSPHQSYPDKLSPHADGPTTLIRSRAPRAPLPRQHPFPRTSSSTLDTLIPSPSRSALTGSLSPSQRLRKLSSLAHICDSQPFWLLLYFSFNLGLTLYNKGILVHFPFPYTLTALHALCGSIGGYVLREKGVFVPARLSPRDTTALVVFSVLYALNIVVSNVSLNLVTVPFHQVVRAATPIFTIALSTWLFGIQSRRADILPLIPVIIGVGLATYGDYYFTFWGLLLTLLGTILAALKTICTNILQSPPLPSSAPPRQSILAPVIPPRLHLHPLDLLTRMSPLAFIQCVAYAHASGELARVRRYSAHAMTARGAGAVLANGAIAFGLNVVSFTANRKAGPLSMTVAANVKQVLTILLAVVIFDLTITTTNALGIMLTLLGGVWYTWVKYGEKSRRGRLGRLHR